jgi:pullulanase/glycogen debranching enzyme
MLRSAHEATRALILCSVRHWVNLGVDGFRFDLASALARDARGRVQTEEAAVISEIRALAMELDFQTVAEASDIGVYLLGRSYPGWLWRQWNGRYRDDVRAFIRNKCPPGCRFGRPPSRIREPGLLFCCARVDSAATSVGGTSAFALFCRRC